MASIGSGTKEKAQLRHEAVRVKKLQKCKTICIGSLTSTIHVLIPILKTLQQLGSVQVISGDKSILLLSSQMATTFERGEILFRYEDEIALVEDFNLNAFHYNVIITTEFLPLVDVDKYVLLNCRHHFREQFVSVEQKYVPIASVFNPTGLTREEISKEEATVFVNEFLVRSPSFAVAEPYLNSLLMQTGTKDFRIDSQIMNFITELLNGIDGCTKNHIRQCLQGKGDTFAGLG